MKKSICFFTILLFNSFPNFSQELIKDQGLQTNEVIQQIHFSGADDMLILKSMHQELVNGAFAFQSGNQNKAIINQQNAINPDISNQTYSFQSGNSNELSIGQIGSGNMLLGFQLGYLAIMAGNGSKNCVATDNNLVLSASTDKTGNNIAVEGERNKMNFSQNGNNNGVMAVQQGADNSILAEQSGNNNYLLAIQKGNNNKVEAYEQRNTTDKYLFDSILQLGENISLSIDGTSNSASSQNKFIQTGTNLVIEVNSDLMNSTGGIDINQRGNEMKVVIDQSFFSFPMK